MMTRRSRRSRAVVPALVSLLAAAALVGCGDDGAQAGAAPAASATTTPSAKKYKLGYINPSGAQPILATLADGAEARAKVLGHELIALDSQLTVNKQISDIDQLISRGVDGIIVYPIDGKAVLPALKKARDRNIAVLGFNALVGDKKGSYTVAEPYQANITQGENRSAEIEADLIGKRLGGKGKIVLVTIAIPVPSLRYEEQRLRTILAERYPDIEILGSVPNRTDNLSGGEEAVTQAVARYGKDIDAVVAYNDQSAIGASLALKRAGVEDVVITGRAGAQEGIDAVKSGAITGDIDQRPYEQGASAVNLITRLLDGENVPPNTDTTPLLITKENVGDYVPWPRGLEDVASGEITGDATE